MSACPLHQAVALFTNTSTRPIRWAALAALIGYSSLTSTHNSVRILTAIVAAVACSNLLKRKFPHKNLSDAAITTAVMLTGLSRINRFAAPTAILSGGLQLTLIYAAFIASLLANHQKIPLLHKVVQSLGLTPSKPQRTQPFKGWANVVACLGVGAICLADASEEFAN